MNRLIAFSLFFLTFACLCFGDAADLLIQGGTIVTMEGSMPQADALAIQGDRIVWIGESKDAGQWINASTKVIDLKGAFAYPGLVDSHAHIVGLGASRLSIDLVGTPNKEAIVTKVKGRVEKSKKGEWITGRGWDQNDWPVKKFPVAADLDAVSTQNPVVLERIDGHALWVNSQALNRAGITSETKDPEGGKIHRDDKGNPTGVLVDNAMDLVSSVMESLTLEETMQRTLIALEESASKGLTFVHDAGSSKRDFEAFKALADQDRLPVRIYSMASMPGTLGESLLKGGPQDNGPYLDLRSIKMLVDGAMGSRGAAMLDPYEDDPDNKGLLLWKENELMNVLQRGKKAGIQMGIHAIGDRANGMILDAYEKIGVKGLRWRIEHAQLLSLQDIPRFHTIDVIASMQPIHATSDMPWFADRVGIEKTKNGAYVWRSLLNHKAIIAAGSDAPVEDINPLWGIYAAITRQDHQGKPKDGWLPEQRLTPQEALRIFTIDAAYAAFREKDLGSLKVGKLADLIVLPENILTCDPKALIDMKVLYTIVGGKIRHGGR